jgi:hypothetical protein
MDSEELVPKVAQAIRKAQGSNLPVRWFYPEAKAAIETVMGAMKSTATVGDTFFVEGKHPWGYVMGDYQCECKDCGEIFVGHKRAWRCKTCADKMEEISTRYKVIWR